MKNERKLREWATPITIGAFALSAITGIMLFFKAELSLVKPLHEWLSWLLVAGATLHLITNWRSTVQYASKPIGKGVLIFFLLLICVSFIPLGGKQGGNPVKRIADTMIQNPLHEVAQVANHEPGEAMNILQSRGIYTESKEQTIQEIAAKNHKSPMVVLDAIF